MIRSEIYHLQMGTKLNSKYVVQGVLGQGGFGITYVGMDEILCRRVAIKEFFPRELAERNNQQGNYISVRSGFYGEDFDKEKQRFLREARALAQFGSVKGVVRVLDFFEENDTAYIVMEYLEGLTLKQAVDTYGVMSVEKMQDIFAPLLETLDRIHQKGVIHRDISPDNIMMLPDGEIKLMDFGAARNYTGFGKDALTSVLKPGYAPLEQYDSHGKQGPWTDIYALAGTMYYCITRKKPQEASQRANADTLRAPSELGVRISYSAENALMKALNIHAIDRYMDLGGFCADLYREVSDDRSVNMDVFTRSVHSYQWGLPDTSRNRTWKEGGWQSDDPIAGNRPQKMQENIPGRVSENDDRKKRKFEKIAIAISTVMLAAALALLAYIAVPVIQDKLNPGRENASTTSEKTAETSEQTSEKNTSAASTADQADETATEASTEVPEQEPDDNQIFQDADAYADYSKCLELDVYQSVESPEGDYSFCYPEGIFNEGYTDGDNCIFITDDGNDSAKFMREEIDPDVSPRKSMLYVYNTYKESMTDFEELLLEETADPDSGYCYAVGCGQSDGRNLYIAVSASDSYVYTMEIYTSHQGRSDKSNWTNYYIECMYRYCSFTRDVGEPRTFDEYMEDQ